MYSSQKTSDVDFSTRGRDNSIYNTSSSSYGTLGDAYFSVSAQTARGGPLTASNFNSLKKTALNQQLLSTPDNRGTQAVVINTVPPQMQNYGGYVSLGNLSSRPATCKY